MLSSSLTDVLPLDTPSPRSSQQQQSVDNRRRDSRERYPLSSLSSGPISAALGRESLRYSESSPNQLSLSTSSFSYPDQNQTGSTFQSGQGTKRSRTLSLRSSSRSEGKGELKGFADILGLGGDDTDTNTGAGVVGNDPDAVTFQIHGQPVTFSRQSLASGGRLAGSKYSTLLSTRVGSSQDNLRIVGDETDPEFAKIVAQWGQLPIETKDALAQLPWDELKQNLPEFCAKLDYYGITSLYDELLCNRLASPIIRASDVVDEAANAEAKKQAMIETVLQTQSPAPYRARLDKYSSNWSVVAFGSQWMPRITYLDDGKIKISLVDEGWNYPKQPVVPEALDVSTLTETNRRRIDLRAAAGQLHPNDAAAIRASAIAASRKYVPYSDYNPPELMASIFPLYSSVERGEKFNDSVSYGYIRQNNKSGPRNDESMSVQVSNEDVEKFLQDIAQSEKVLKVSTRRFENYAHAVLAVFITNSYPWDLVTSTLSEFKTETSTYGYLNTTVPTFDEQTATLGGTRKLLDALEAQIVDAATNTISSSSSSTGGRESKLVGLSSSTYPALTALADGYDGQDDEFEFDDHVPTPGYARASNYAPVGELDPEILAAIGIFPPSLFNDRQPQLFVDTSDDDDENYGGDRHSFNQFGMQLPRIPSPFSIADDDEY